jgi:GDPmannose 4,6-dehydratase
LFNHESPRRGENFVTRKIARAVARIARGLETELVLGNLESRRDWGRAQDYVEAMWLMLQHERADDYVVATGETHSVREFVETAFALVNLHWRDYVRQDAKLYRAADVTQLVGSADKIRETVGWQARGTFEQLVREMVEAELAAVDRAAA